MAKKNEKEEFDLTKALAECPKPDWYVTAFCRVMDLSKIKSQDDLIKEMKKFGAMN